MTISLKAAILRHWELDRSLLPTLVEGSLSKIRFLDGTVLDTLLETVATLRDSPPPYLTLIEYSILKERYAEARLIWQTIDRQRAIDPSWMNHVEAILFAWLIVPEQTPPMATLGEELLVGPATLRRAFLPLVLDRLRIAGDSATAGELVVRWLTGHPEESDAWWSGALHALETHDDELLTNLLRERSLPRQVETEWHWATALRLAVYAPEPHCWTLLEQVVALSRTRQMPLSELRQLLAKTLPEHEASSIPRASLVSVLVSTALGDTPRGVRDLCSFSSFESPVERALAATLAVRWIEPADVSTELATMLAELLEGIRTGREFAGVIHRLDTAVQPLALCEYALRLGEYGLARHALALLADLRPMLPEFLSLANRLDLAGATEAAIEVLRLAARQCHQRHDRAGVVRALRALVQLDPRDRAALEFVVNADTQSGRVSQAIDTLLAAANRAAHVGDRSLQRALLERAATIAELAEDRPRLALIAELLAEVEPDNSDRHLAAATALLRAGETERARAHLWAAVRTALQRRRLDEALVAAEQLVALNPTDEAAVAQLEDLRLVSRHISQHSSAIRSSLGD